MGQFAIQVFTLSDHPKNMSNSYEAYFEKYLTATLNHLYGINY